jgi:ankyrin repeat protein
MLKSIVFFLMYMHAEIIALLIDHGAKLNTRDIGGNTPLHLALMEGNEDIALYLVEQGADLKAMNSEKIRCLDLAKPAFLTQVQARMERP